MINTFFGMYAPRRSHKIAFSVFFIFIVGYSIGIYFSDSMNVFSIYRHAVQTFLSGGQPYVSAAGPNEHFMYSPTSLIVLFTPLGVLPHMWGSLAWQMLNLAVYCVGVLVFFNTFSHNGRSLKVWASCMFSFLLFANLNVNSIYFQSNTLLVGGMILGVGLYMKKKYLLAALVLAFLSNMKIVPFALALMLCVDLKWKYIATCIAASIFFAVLPVVFVGIEETIDLYTTWGDVLSVDRNLEFTGNQRFHYIGLNALIQNWFGVVPDTRFAVIPAVIGAALAGVYFIRFRPFTNEHLALLVGLILPYIFLFNTRTEGPYLVFLAPVQAIMFINLYRYDVFRKKVPLYIGFFFLVWLTMLSKTDFSPRPFRLWIWHTHARTVGVALLFLHAVVALFWRKWRIQFFGGDSNALAEGAFVPDSQPETD